MKYIVWYSWWIDSSYVAWKLKNEWHDVLLVNLKITNDANKCCNISSEIFNSARNLGLKLEIIDLVDKFKHFVIDDFATCYLAWITPNPCIRCNEFVRFEALEEVRKKYWYDYITTWHYAKLLEINWNKVLAMAQDIHKDQTYMLYRLANTTILEHLILPMWDFIKTNVIKQIFDNNLPIIVNKESQNVCFIPDDDYKRFIKQNYLTNVPSWQVYDDLWNYLAEHKGIIYYTVWQKFWISWSDKKYYVLKINKENNTIVVWDEKLLYKDSVLLKDFFFNLPVDWAYYAKIRYHSQLQSIKSIDYVDNETCKIIFNDFQRAPTPWQHCVIYNIIWDVKYVIWWWVIL